MKRFLGRTLVGLGVAGSLFAAGGTPRFSQNPNEAPVVKDTDGNGRIDQIEITFDEAVRVYDTNGANDGLPCLVFKKAAVSGAGETEYFTKPKDYGTYVTGSANAENPKKKWVIDLIEGDVLGDTGVVLEVTYKTGAGCKITGSEGTDGVAGVGNTNLEMSSDAANKSLPSVDNARPVITQASQSQGSDAATQNQKLLILALSEGVSPASLTLSDPSKDFEVYTGDNPDPAHSINVAATKLKGALYSREMVPPDTSETTNPKISVLKILMPDNVGMGLGVGADWSTKDWIRLAPQRTGGETQSTNDVLRALGLEPLPATLDPVGTAAVPQPTDGIRDASKNQNYADGIKGPLAPFVSGSAVTPTVTSVTALDLATGNVDGMPDGKVDTYKVVFNTEVKDTTYLANRYRRNDPANQFVLLDEGAGQGFRVVDGDSSNDKTIYLKIDPSQGNTNTDQVGKFLMGAGFIRSIGGAPANKAEFNKPVDGCGPYPLSVQTMDIDGNGKVDHLKITWSEKVQDSSFDATKQYSSFELTGTAGGIAGDTANDNITYVGVKEGELPVTYLTGADFYVAGDRQRGGGTFKDFRATGNTDPQASSVYGEFYASQNQLKDGVAPKLVSVTATGTTTLVVTFSEQVFTNNNPDDQGTRALLAGDFKLNIPGTTFGNSDVRGVNVKLGIWKIVNLSKKLKPENLGVDTLEVTADNVYDGAGNVVVPDAVVIKAGASLDDALKAEKLGLDGAAAAGGCFVGGAAAGGMPWGAMALLAGAGAGLLMRRKQR